MTLYVPAAGILSERLPVKLELDPPRHSPVEALKTSTQEFATAELLFPGSLTIAVKFGTDIVIVSLKARDAPLPVTYEAISAFS